MQSLNYHHLLYFFLVAREGGLLPASEKLRLAQSTISGQIHALEQALGEKLFVRSGRRLMLTEIGRHVYRYAEEIFSLGQELKDSLDGRSSGRPMALNVGVADAVPKLVAQRILEPALRLEEPVRLVCREGKPDHLLAELAVYGLDVVLSDAPTPPSVRIRAFSHLLGECGITFFATAPLAEAHRRNFPRSLNGAPMLLPTENTALRRSLDQWFTRESLHPTIVGEFEDSALLKVFGQSGAGIFPAHSVIAEEVRRAHQVHSVGRTDEVRERFYAISVERRLKHPAVVAITAEARAKLFG